MTEETANPPQTKLPFWPFVLAEGLFLGLAVIVLKYAHRPLLLWEVAALVVCVAGGAWSLITPVLRRHEDQKADTLTTAVEQIKNLEEVAKQIAMATSQWQGVQEHAASTTNIAKELAEGMAAEAKSFTEFLGKADQTEKNHLRLEAEKLRRNEGEWLQVTTRILDQVFALFQAAARSGQPNLAQQISQFQEACRDTARRIGLMPLVPTDGEAFDAGIHQLMDEAAAPENAIVGEVLATGYMYQGQLIRRALVKLQTPATTA